MSEPRVPAPRPTTLQELHAKLRSAPASTWVATLIDQPNVRQLVAQLSPQDLLRAVHAAGVADSLELLELLPPRQVQRVVDLEAWQRDRLDPRRLASWLRVLYEADARRALAQIMGLDVELVTLFLKLHCRVYDLSKDEAPEDFPEGAIETPDHRYLVTFVPPPHPQGRERPDPTDEMGTEVARKLVADLIARDPFLAARYLEAVRWELPSELEETSCRWRRGRLEDLGFTDTYEAMALYAVVDLNRATRPTPAEVMPHDGAPEAALALVAEIFEGAPLLRRALSRLDDEAADLARLQLTLVSNRVAAARALPFGEPDALTAALAEVAATVNLGLEYLSRGDDAEAAQSLRQIALTEIFRCGHTLVRQIADRARRLHQRLTLPPHGALLLRGTEALFHALCKKLPLVPAELVVEGARGPIESVAQLARVAELVAETAFAATVVLDVLELSPTDLQGLANEADNIASPAELSLDAVLGTVLCGALAGGGPGVAPLTSPELGALRDLLAGGAEALLQPLVSAVVAAVQGRLPLPGARDVAEAEQRSRAVLSRLATELAAELSPVEGEVDTRFVRAVLCRGERSAT